MNESKKMAVANEISPYSEHRFLILIMSSILIAFCLVVVSMFLYNISGTAQLDLSRPGYVSVRSKTTTTDSDFENYPSTGSINQKTISEFKALYLKQATKIKSADAFGGNPLGFDSLGLDITSAQ